ncbi:MAG: DUF3467 domain-containing protein [Acidobacteriota bacterium]|jgi:hypothetical protein
MSEQEPRDAAKRVPVKVTDEVVGGVYSNHMVVSHTQEEFFIDFFTMLPQFGKLASRVIASPGHMKRIARALNENLARYESRYGTIPEAPGPSATPSGSVN